MIFDHLHERLVIVYPEFVFSLLQCLCDNQRRLVESLCEPICKSEVDFGQRSIRWIIPSSQFGTLNRLLEALFSFDPLFVQHPCFAQLVPGYGGGQRVSVWGMCSLTHHQIFEVLVMSQGLCWLIGRGSNAAHVVMDLSQKCVKLAVLLFVLTLAF